MDWKMINREWICEDYLVVHVSFIYGGSQISPRWVSSKYRSLDSMEMPLDKIKQLQLSFQQSAQSYVVQSLHPNTVSQYCNAAGNWLQPVRVRFDSLEQDFSFDEFPFLFLRYRFVRECHVLFYLRWGHRERILMRCTCDSQDLKLGRVRVQS